MLVLGPLAPEDIAMDNTEANRRSIKSASPNVRLSASHVANCRVLPRREDLLELLPTGGICAEIGVAKGEFTKEILARNKPAQLHLIDTWSTERYRDDLQIVRQKFASEIEHNQVFVHQGASTDVLEDFADGFFDWLYVDTNHTYETTKRELDLARQKTKHGGRIAGHDFTSGNSVKPWPYGVIEACHEFCALHAWEYEYLTLESHGHFSFCIKETV